MSWAGRSFDGRIAKEQNVVGRLKEIELSSQHARTHTSAGVIAGCCNAVVPFVGDEGMPGCQMD
jgi:hypothetical protein